MKASFILGLSLIVILFSACTEETIINNYYTSAPLDSNWQKCNGPYSTSVHFMYYSFDGNIFTYSGHENEYMKSTDAGESWTSIDFGTSLYFFNAKKGKDGYYYAMDYKLGLFKSRDGVNWTNISHPLIDANGRYDFYYNSYNVLENGALMIGIAWSARSDSGNSEYFAVLYRSNDGGANWSAVMNGNDSLKNVYSLRLGVNGYLYLYQFDVSHGRIYKIICSKDNGLTWNKTSDVLHDNDEQFYSFQDGTIFLEYYSNLSRSDDNGVTFTTKNKGLYGLVNSLFLGENNYFYCSTTTGLYRSTNKGDSWEPLLENIGNINSAFRSNTGHIYFILNNAIIYRTKKANMY